MLPDAVPYGTGYSSVMRFASLRAQLGGLGTSWHNLDILLDEVGGTVLLHLVEMCNVHVLLYMGDVEHRLLSSSSDKGLRFTDASSVLQARIARPVLRFAWLWIWRSRYVGPLSVFVEGIGDCS